MVCRVSRKTRKSNNVQKIEQPIIRVSKAVLPKKRRYRVATDKIAQLHRFFIMGCSWIIDTCSLLGLLCLYFIYKHTVAVRLMRMGSALLIASGSIFLLLILSGRPLVLDGWFVPALFAILLAVVMTTLWLEERFARQAMMHRGQRTSLSSPSVSSLALGSYAGMHSQAGYYISQMQRSSTRSFPATPVPTPAAPLIRVLETIDLSGTNIEHFLDIEPSPSTFPSRCDRQGEEGLL